MNTLAVIFLAVFVIGPFAFFRLIRPRPDAAQLRNLAGLTLVCVALSVALRLGLLGRAGDGRIIAWTSIGLIWMAWIGILALGAQRIRLAYPDKRTRKWTAIFGGLGTTLPWFGLASARMMTV